MVASEAIYLAVYFLTLFGLAYPLGMLIADVMQGRRVSFLAWLSPLERASYFFGGVDPAEKQSPWAYFLALLLFNGAGMLLLMGILMFQGYLPLNPEHFGGMSFDLAFNTAISFITNTNWQAYSGETSVSYFSQMVGLAVQNFLSASVGMAVVMVMVRGLLGKQEKQVGNFWVDLTRFTIYILLPLSILVTLILMSQGVVQNFLHSMKVTTLEGAEQIIPMGPAASQIAIKQLGTNGGGFFGVNSAHPFENPTPISDFLQLVCILLIPVAQVFAFGKMIKQPKQGLSILSAMTLVFVATLAFSLYSEFSTVSSFAHGISMEGKEVRFGQMESVLWSVATTAASNGSVNAMHSSLSPLSGGVAIFNMMLGEVIYGGVGAGLYGMFLHVLLTVFIAGLMVGRTPEYLGKKIEAREITWVMVGIILPSALILLGSGLASVCRFGLSSLSSQGPHALSELLYTFSSTAGNNGSAFAGFNANTRALNLILGMVMAIGRFAVIYPVIAISGLLAAKKFTPATAGTFPTDSYLFTFLLVSVILIVGALTFFPALALGPIVEHFLVGLGKTF